MPLRLSDLLPVLVVVDRLCFVNKATFSLRNRLFSHTNEHPSCQFSLVTLLNKSLIKKNPGAHIESFCNIQVLDFLLVDNYLTSNYFGKDVAIWITLPEKGTPRR